MEVLLWTGTGQLGTAIVRRIGSGMKIIAADINPAQAENAAELLEKAGFNVLPTRADISSRDSVRELVELGQRFGEITALVNSAGVSPLRSSIERILQVNLLGTALLLEEVGKVIAVGGAGVTLLGQAGRRIPALGAEEDARLGETSTDELLSLDVLKRENISDRVHACALAAYAGARRVMAQAVKWGERGARLNSITVGMTASPLSFDELGGSHGEYYRNMYMKSPAARLGTPDEIAEIAELLMSRRGSFITGADILADGGATAAYYYGSLKPQ